MIRRTYISRDLIRIRRHRAGDAARERMHRNLDCGFVRANGAARDPAKDGFAVESYPRFRAGVSVRARAIISRARHCRRNPETS